MKVNFFNDSPDSERLILIFPGWSCGRELYSDFSFPGWEKAVVDDYSSPKCDLSVLERFSTIYIFAWSLGIYLASVIDFKNIVTAAFALNGTLNPVSDAKGIPTNIYNKTAENLSSHNLLKFRRRMAGDSSTFATLFSQPFSEQETAILRDQLLSIQKWQSTLRSFPLPWKKVFLSEEDAIFPFENMYRAWQDLPVSNPPSIVKIKGPHYIPMERVIRMAIPEQSRIAQRFTNAEETYDENATAQRQLSLFLTDMLRRSDLTSNKKILEIGCGTGLFTHQIIHTFHPQELVLVDIADVHPDTGDIRTRFYKDDAEKWVAKTEHRFDAVLSSATIQWFVNLPLFFRNVANILNQDGLIGFSTFLPGNLQELDFCRPSPIHYHSSEEIIEWLKEDFEITEFKEIDYLLNFNSARELFNHIRFTGVGGSAPLEKLPPSRIKHLNHLTFKCGCFIARKK